MMITLNISGNNNSTETYSFSVDDNGRHKKVKGVNANVIATIIHNKYKDVLLNKKCLRHSINTTQSKDHR